MEEVQGVSIRKVDVVSEDGEMWYGDLSLAPGLLGEPACLNEQIWHTWHAYEDEPTASTDAGREAYAHTWAYRTLISR